MPLLFLRFIIKGGSSVIYAPGPIRFTGDIKSEVLPVPPCPTTATFFSAFDSYFAMKTPF
jgi:hypothetical protein